MARMRSSLIAATATLAALAAPTAASAATTTCSGLQAALDDEANSVVTLAEGQSCHQRYDLPSRAITLEGGGTGATLNGPLKGSDRILAGDSVGETTIRNLTFIGGEVDESNGGAIRLTGDSPATIEDNRFFSNGAVGGGSGGAVALELDNQTVNRTGRLASPPVTLSGNTFGGTEQGNHGESRGGAVYIDAFFRSLVIEDNVFDGNDAGGGDGGGLHVDASQHVTLSGNTFTGNQGGDDGGGAALSTCGATITDNVFDGNRIEDEDETLDGGGLKVSDFACNDDLAPLTRGGSAAQDVTQSGNQFANNQIRGEFSTGRGGGEYVEGLTLLSTNDSYVGNSIAGTDSGFGGGLAYIGPNGAPFAARNLVAAGNVVDPTNQPPPVRGSAIPSGFGGGVFLGAGGAAEYRVEDSTIQGNTAPFGGGISDTPFNQGSRTRGEIRADALVLHNSIVFGNTNATGDDVAGFGSRDVRSSDTCSEGDPHAGAGNRCIDPKLAAPATDGNVNQAAGGPTIDAGDASLVDADVTIDYRGDGRVLGGKVDIGADEYKPAAVTKPPPAAQPPAPAPAAGGVQGAQQRSCVSKRVFRIRIRVPKGKHASSAVVRVNGKKVKVVRGKRLRAPVRLRGLPKGKFKVRITLRLTNGRKLSGTRTYHTCIPKLPGDGPPKL